MFLFGVRKTVALHYFLTPKNRILKQFESKCQDIYVYLKHVARFYLVEWSRGGG